MIHDNFCRCRACKPPLPAIDSAEIEMRMRVAMLALGIAAGTIVAWFAAQFLRGVL